MKRKILSIICVLCLILSLGIKSFADFGDYGGDSDYGGGSDWGSSDNDYDYDYDDDDDYDYDDDDDNNSGSSSSANYWFVGYTDGGSGDGGASVLMNNSGKVIASAALLCAASDDSAIGFVGVVLVAAIVASIIIARKRKKSSASAYTPKRSANLPAGAQPTDRSTLNNISDYTDVDPDFSEAEFCSDISNMYVQFQNAWQNKNIEELRPYLTDEFYARMDRQLDNYRRNHQTNMVERIAVLGVAISGWKQQKNQDVIVARVRTRIVDYVIDDNTNKIVRGSSTAEKFMEYEWTLSRKSGVKTGVDSGVRTLNCPNCGAPLNISRTAKCEYCGSIITVDSTDWVVTDMKGLSQRTK